MLHGTGNAAGDVQLGRHDLARLAHLMVPGHPALLDGRTACTDHAAQQVRQFLHHGEVLGAAHAAAAGHDDFGVLQIHHLRQFLHGIPDHRADFRNRHGLLLDRRSASLFPLRLAEAAGTDRHHSRAFHCHGLQQRAAVHRADPTLFGEAIGVGNTAGAQPGRHPCRQFLAVPGGTHQQAVRLIALAQLRQSCGVALGLIAAYLGAQDLCGAVGTHLRRGVSAVQQHCRHGLAALLRRQALCGIERLQARLYRLAVSALHVYQNAMILHLQILPQISF